MSKADRQRRWREGLRQKQAEAGVKKPPEAAETIRSPATVRQGTPVNDPEQDTEPDLPPVVVPPSIQAEAEAAAKLELKKLDAIKKRKAAAKSEAPPEPIDDLSTPAGRIRAKIRAEEKAAGVKPGEWYYDASLYCGIARADYEAILTSANAKVFRTAKEQLEWIRKETEKKALEL